MTPGRLIGIAWKDKPRQPMREATPASISVEAGIAGDFRVRAGDRQVTILFAQDWEAACAALGDTRARTIRRANLFVADIPNPRAAGGRLIIGDVELAITGETKPCANMDRQWPGLTAALAPDRRGGLTARVLRGGEVRVGMGWGWLRGSRFPRRASCVTVPQGTGAACMDDIWSLIQQYFLEVAVAIGIALLAWFRGQIWNVIVLHFTAIRRIQQAQRALKADKPWMIRPARSKQSSGASSVPIVTIANLKGGVGKTTLTANLAAYFATETRSPMAPERKRRVLVIDLDFQGSASSMLLKREDRLPGPGQLSDASDLLLGLLRERDVVRALGAVAPEGVQVIPAYYDLARTETRLQLQWMIGDERSDIRYRLRDILNAPAVQEKFDLILIDAPPRLTTATIAALCASTHLLIPTILDVVSGEAVGSFLDQIEELRDLWHDLKFIGVVGTMVAENPALERPLRASEQAGITAVSGAIEEVFARHNLNPPQDAMFPRSTYIVDSELIRVRSGTVFFVNLGNDERAVAVKDVFRALGREIEKRLQ
jgi:cellulose biosynthesis protein BcsQ